MEWKKVLVFGMLVNFVFLFTEILPEEESFDLGEVVITATKTPHLLKETPGTITIITEEEIKNKNVKDIGDILQDIAGVKILRYGGVGSQSTINLRGLFSTHTLVLIDGMPINSPDTGSVDLSQIPVDNIERIEIIKGPFSALYGANAVSGVVNIITKSPPEKFITDIETEFGSWERFKIGLDNGGKLGKFGYLFNSGYQETEGARDNSFFRINSTDLKTQYIFSDDNILSLKLSYHGSKSGVPGPKPSSDPTLRNISQLTYGNEEVSSLKDYQEEEYINFSLGWNWEKLKMNLYSNQWNKDFYDWYAWQDWFGVLHQNEAEYHHNPITNGLNLEYNIPCGENHLFTTGISLVNEEYSYKSKDVDKVASTSTDIYFDSSRDTLSFLFQDEIKKEPFTFVIGARYDEPDDYSSQVSPRASFLWSINDKTNMKVSAGKAYRQPTLSDLYWPSDPYSQGNPNLQPEDSYSYEMGLERVFFEKILVRLTGFYQEVKDMIQWAPTGPPDPWGTPKWQPSNIGKVQTTGLETEAKFVFNKKINSIFRWTLLNSTQSTQEIVNGFTYAMEERERTTRYTPKHKFDFDLNCLNFLGIDITLNYQYVTEIFNYYLDWANMDFVTGEVPMAIKKLSPYNVVNLKASKKLKSGEIFFTVDNIFNEEYSTQFGNEIYDQNYPMPERSFNLGMKIEF